MPIAPHQQAFLDHWDNWREKHGIDDAAPMFTLYRQQTGFPNDTEAEFMGQAVVIPLNTLGREIDLALDYFRRKEMSAFEVQCVTMPSAETRRMLLEVEAFDIEHDIGQDAP
jgi:hypothetical protein